MTRSCKELDPCRDPCRDPLYYFIMTLPQSHMLYIFRLDINDTVYPLSEKLPSQFCFS